MVLKDNYFKVNNLAIDGYKVLDSNGKVVRKSLFSNAIEKLLFVTLARYANNSEAFPSQERLAQDVICSVSMIEKTIRKLKEKGLIIVIKKPNRKTNTYNFPDLKEKHLEAFGPEYIPKEKGVEPVHCTDNKELYKKNKNKKTNNENIDNLKEFPRSKKILSVPYIEYFFQEILREAKLKINNQTKRNIMRLLILGKVSLERVKEVFNYVDMFKKNGGFLFSALKFNWILKWHNQGDKDILKLSNREAFIEMKECEKKSVDSSEEVIEVEEIEKINEKSFHEKEIFLSEEEEKKALEIAKEKKLSIFHLKVKSRGIYIRTLKNLLES